MPRFETPSPPLREQRKKEKKERKKSGASGEQQAHPPLADCLQTATSNGRRRADGLRHAEMQTEVGGGKSAGSPRWELRNSPSLPLPFEEMKASAGVQPGEMS